MIGGIQTRRAKEDPMTFAQYATQAERIQSAHNMKKTLPGTKHGLYE